MRRAWQRWSGRTLLAAINTAGAFAIFFEGYDQGVMGGVNGSPDYSDKMQLVGADGVPDATKIGGLVAIYYLGSLFGGFLGGWVGDRFGRIKGVGAGALWCIVGGALQAGAVDTPMMLVARVIAGIGCGHLNVITPAWTAEVSEARERGKMIALVFMANYIGIAVAYWLAYGLSYVDGGNGDFRWRFGLAFQIIPAFFLFIILFMLPESPRWLIKVGRNQEALEVITVLRGDGDGNAPGVQEEYNAIVAGVELEKRHAKRNSFYAMLFGLHCGDLHFARRVQIAMWIPILTLVGTGIMATTVYTPTIFKQAGYDANKANWLSGLNNTVGIFGTLINSYIIDRLGRRKTLFIGAVGQCICMFLSGGLAAAGAKNPEHAAQYGAASASFIFGFTFCFSSTWLMGQFTIPAEIFPTEVRTKGNGFGVFGWSVGCGIAVLAAPIWFQRLGEKTFYIFGALNLVYVPLLYCFLPETGNKTLEQMDMLFASKSWFAWDQVKEYNRLMAAGGLEGEFSVGDNEKAIGKNQSVKSVGSADEA